MIEDRPPKPHLTERARAEAEARRTREAAALRENLRRRKAQARIREDTPIPAEAAPENIG